MTSGQALPAPLPKTPSCLPLKLLTGTLEAPRPSGSPGAGSANAQAAGATTSYTDRYTARVARRDTHTHAGSSPRGHTHTHTSLPFLAPCTRTRHAHTHTHPHTPGAWVEEGPGKGGRGGWVCRCGPSPVLPPPSSAPPADTPRTELCNWIEICKRNANWKTNPNPRAEGQPQIHSTFLPPPHPQTVSVSRGPGRGRGAELVVLPCG